MIKIVGLFLLTMFFFTLGYIIGKSQEVNE